MIEVRKLTDRRRRPIAIEVKLYGSITDSDRKELFKYVKYCFDRGRELLCNGYLLLNWVGGMYYLGLNVLDPKTTSYLLSMLSRHIEKIGY